LLPVHGKLMLMSVLVLAGADLLVRRGIIQGVFRRRARTGDLPARSTETLYIGLPWCAVGIIPLAAAYFLWTSLHP
jgi:hypothetical protein